MKLPCFLVIFLLQTIWVTVHSSSHVDTYAADDTRENNHVPGRKFKMLGTYHVRVRNDLSKKLWLHCRSKDDDLGLQELPAHGDFRWSFKMNFWGTTLYWCEAQKELSPEHVSFTAFSGDPAILDNCKGNVCKWAARQDGMYMITPHATFQFEYPWKKK